MIHYFFKMKKLQRRYKKKLASQLLSNDQFLVEALRNEWDEIQKTAKREELVRKSKEAGLIIAKSILVLLAIGGVMTIALVAPNVFGAFGKASRRRGFFDKRGFRKATSYLKTRGMVNVHSNSDDMMKVEITDRGRETVLREAFSALKITRSAKWDGRWRVVAFDIPNRHKWSRDGFRQKLRVMGFYQLQKSLFIIPYDCEKEVRFLSSIFNVSGYIVFLETETIKNIDQVAEHFGL